MARFPRDIIDIIMKYKKIFDKIEAFERFFNEIWAFLLVSENWG